MADFSVANHGSIVTVTPLTPAAQEWLDEHVQAESWQFMGRALCVDHRYAGPLIEGIVGDGFEVE